MRSYDRWLASCGIAVALMTLMASRARADSSDEKRYREALEACQRQAKALLQDLESKGGSYLQTFYRWETECVTEGKNLVSLSGYDDVRTAHKKLRPIADKLSAQNTYQTVVDETWQKIDVTIGPLEFEINAEKSSPQYKRAMEDLAACEKMLSDLFAKYPEARTLSRRDRTLGDVYKFCSGGAVAEDDTRRTKGRQKWVNDALKEIAETESRYEYNVKHLAEIRKIVASNRKYAALQAARNFDEVVGSLGSNSSTIDRALGDAPELKTTTFKYAGKQWTGAALSKFVREQLETAQAENDANERKVPAQEKQWKSEFLNSVKGDRAKIARKLGMPNSYDGSDEDDPLVQMKKLTSTGTFWIYNGGSCEVRYNFRGANKLSMEVTPRGCRDD